MSSQRQVMIFCEQKMKDVLYLISDNGRLWVEVIIVYFLDAVATVEVLTAASNDDVKLVETRTVHFA